MLSKYLYFISYIKVILFHLFEKYAQNIRKNQQEINIPKEKKQTVSAKGKKNNQKYKNNIKFCYIIQTAKRPGFTFFSSD